MSEVILAWGIGTALGIALGFAVFNALDWIRVTRRPHAPGKAWGLPTRRGRTPE